MEQFHMIAGMPRSGSTLLCQILNMNPDFFATPTSPILDMVQAQQSCYSHNGGFKATNRLNSYDNFSKAQKAFLEQFYDIEGTKVVFDKNRGWPVHLLQLDAILQHSEAKILWTYRDPVQIICSMEARHRQIPLIQYIEESQNPGMFATLDRRVNNWINDNGIVAFPGWALHDAVEMGYGSRIHVVRYYDLCTQPQKTLNKIHDFLQLPRYDYDADDFKDLRQTTLELDTFYNYKYPHTIKEGEISLSSPTIELPQRYVDMINQRFAWVNQYVAAKLEESAKPSTPIEQQTPTQPQNQIIPEQGDSNDKE